MSSSHEILCIIFRLILDTPHVARPLISDTLSPALQYYLYEYRRYSTPHRVDLHPDIPCNQVALSIFPCSFQMHLLPYHEYCTCIISYYILAISLVSHSFIYIINIIIHVSYIVIIIIVPIYPL